MIVPSVRLAYNPGPINAYNALAPHVRLAYHPEGNRTLSELGPTVRLATTIDGGGATGPKQFERHLAEHPSVRLALGGAHSQDKQMAMADISTRPALLVSYVYLKPF